MHPLKLNRQLIIRKKLFKLYSPAKEFIVIVRKRDIFKKKR